MKSLDKSGKGKLIIITSILLLIVGIAMANESTSKDLITEDINVPQFQDDINQTYVNQQNITLDNITIVNATNLSSLNIPFTLNFSLEASTTYMIPTEFIEMQPIIEEPIEEFPIEEQPLETQPIEALPTEEQPTDQLPIEEMPNQEQPLETQPIEELPIEEQPLDQLPIEEMPSEEQPIEEIPNATSNQPLTVPTEENNNPNNTNTPTGAFTTQEVFVITAFSGDGGGTFTNPYNITNCTQLQEMENDLGANFSITTNINCSDTINWNSGQGFDPIGSNSPKFVGSLDGNSFNITKLFISRTTTYNGLFGYIGAPGNVSSLSLLNASIKGGQYTGGLVGHVDASTFVDHINVTGEVTATSSYSGGITGQAATGSTFDHCYFVGNLTGSTYTGGLIGDSRAFVNNSGVKGRIVTGQYGGGFIGIGGGEIQNSYAITETVTTSTSLDNIGGFAGTLSGGANITNSYAEGNVSGDQYIGGFVGELNSGARGLISNSYSTSNVYGISRDIGGFIGVYWAGININNSYARGNVTGTGSTSYAGGFIGEPVLTSPTTTISNSYATGNLSGVSASISGGFTGYMTSAFVCENNFWDNQTSKSISKGSGNCIATGKNTSDMKNVSTFTDTSTNGLTTPWDFVGDPNNDTGSKEIWDIDSVTNDGYPVLASIGVGATLGTPTVTLNAPVDGFLDQEQLVNVTFNCSATDSVALENLSLYLSDSNNQNIILNQSTPINGTSNSTAWHINLINGTYTWQCEVQDPDGNTRTSSTRSLAIGDTYGPLITYVSPTLVNASSIVVTDFQVNVTVDEINLKELKFNFNGTNYTMYNASLVLAYNFDNISTLGENHTYVFDVSGNNNNGTSVNEAGSIVAGKYGSAYDFDGVNDRVTTPSTFGILTTNFSISAWVNLDSTSEAGAFVKIGGTSPNQGFGIGVGATTFDDAGNDLILNYEGVRWIDTNDAIGTGWHHIAMIINSSGHPSGYIDGVRTYTDNTGVGSAPQQDITYIGGYTGSGAENRHTDITIDEVRIWNATLSSEDIYQHYVSNLKKINRTFWEFYINQSKNSTDGLARTSFTYFVSAFDDYSFQNSSNVTTITVDASGPAFSTFANQTVEYGSEFSYDIDATDPSGVSCFTVNDTANFQINCSGYLENNTVLALAAYWLNITTNDTNNFQTSENFWVNNTDTTAPTITITYPTNGTNTTNTNLNVNFTTADFFLESCWYTNDTLLSNTSLTSCGSNLTNITWSEGQHNVTFWANDTSGNENSTEITFIVDNTGPEFTTFANQTLGEKSSLSYDIDATDTVGVSCFTVNDSTNFAIDCDGLLTNNTLLAIGSYRINVSANDTINNLNYDLLWVNVTTTSKVGLTLVSPTTDINVSYNTTFTVEVTVSCFDADCGEVNVSLDPIGVDDIKDTPVTENFETNDLNIQSIITLLDNRSFTYDIQDGCDIADGESDVFDGGLLLYINNSEYTGTRSTTEDAGREAICDPQNKSSMNVSRKVYVPHTENWARYLEVLHNTGSEKVCVAVKISQNMGSDGSDFMNTSDHNNSWEVSDHWMMWDDTNIAAGDDAAGFIYQQDSATETIDTLSPVTASGGANNWVWDDVCVDAGQTKILMHFFTQWNSRAESENESTIIYNNFDDATHTLGMSANEKTQVANWALSSAGKGGLVSMNTSATPFYTTTTNPYNLTLNAGESETITFTINATGAKNTTFEFYVQANITSDMTIGNQTATWNVTIVNNTELSAPAITISFPLTGGHYNTNITALNYTVTTSGQILNQCWGSTDSGVTNTSKVSAGVNFTGFVSSSDANSWTVYCDDNNSLVGTSTTTFTKQPILSLDWVTPTKNINVTQNETFTVSATLTCTNADCHNVNVTLDPVGTPVSCKELYAQGNVADGEYIIYPDGSTPISVYCDMTRESGGWTLFANMQPNLCVESLPFGNFNLTNITNAYFTKNLGLMNHSQIMLAFYDAGVFKFNFVMNFASSKNLSQRWIDIVATGENVSWTANDGTNDFTGIVHDYEFSDGAGLTSAGWGSRTTFSGDDGIWGVANATQLDGNPGPYLTTSGVVGAFGFQNANTGDAGCNTYYINGTGTASTNWTANAFIKEQAVYDTAKSGIISMVNGTTPFYTTTSNPYNISLSEGASSTITWTVNATGDQNVSHQFFIYANWTSNQTVKTVTRIWNITILNETTALGPTISILSPGANSFSTDTGLDILYTATSATLDSCWYTSDGGATNTSLANCANITSPTWSETATTVTIYANDTENLVASASVTFTIDLTNPTLTLIAPVNDTTSDDRSLNVTFIASDTNRDSCWYSNDTMTKNTTLTSCANITTVTWSVGQHNVTIWVNDSVNKVTSSSVNFTITTLFPLIDFISPTAGNNTYQTRTHVQANLSIVESDIAAIKWNWNGTNYTMYNDSLIVFYNFDNFSALGENHTYVFDISGNNNNGTSVNEAGSTAAGKYSNAFDFDGVDDRVTIPSTFGIITTNFTVSAWVNLDSTSEAGAFVKIGGTSPNQGFGIGVGATTFDTAGNDLILLYEGSRWIDTNDPMGTGWHHVALVVNSSGHPSGYIDGIRTYTDTTGAGSAPQEDITYIGGYTGSGAENRHADVTIDELRIWNRTLNAEEMYQEYVTNLRKINQTQWYLYVNQSQNSTDSLGDGAYTFFAVATDNEGNSNLSSTRTITIDTTNPTITIATPTNETNTTIQGLNINFTALDINLESCWYNDNDGTNTTLTNCDNITGITWTEGQHNLTIFANDTVNNQGQSGVTFTVDSGIPLVSISTPANNTFTINSMQNINFTATDSSLESCWYNDNDGSNITLVSCGNITNVTWSEQQHIINIWANDTFSNQGSDQVTFTIDITAPNLVLAYPPNGSNTTNSQLQINFTAQDVNLASCRYSNDSMTSNTTLGNCNNITTVTWQSGNHNVTIWANDSAGNENQTYVTFTILPDLDGDNLADDDDPLLWNESNVTTTGVSKLNITVGGKRTNETISGTNEINFYDGAEIMINFTHNFSQTNIDLSNITIIKTATSLVVNLSGQLKTPYTKTLYLNDNSFASLCVKDEQIGSVNAITAGCSGSNETDFTSCLGGSLRSNGLNCTDLGSRIKFANLQHSGIRGTQAGASPSNPTGSSSGGGGGGSRAIAPVAEPIPECLDNSDCQGDKACWHGSCVKLFDIKVLEVEPAISTDGEVVFTYFIKGMADISDDVIVRFWLEKDGEIVTSGQDTIYIGNFEEFTDSTKLFIPDTLNGSYQFIIQVHYQNYFAEAHRTIQIKAGERTVFLEPAPALVGQAASTDVGRVFVWVFPMIIVLILAILLAIHFFKQYSQATYHLENLKTKVFKRKFKPLLPKDRFVRVENVLQTREKYEESQKLTKRLETTNKKLRQLEETMEEINTDKNQVTVPKDEENNRAETPNKDAPKESINVELALEPEKSDAENLSNDVKEVIVKKAIIKDVLQEQKATDLEKEQDTEQSNSQRKLVKGLLKAVLKKKKRETEN